jgi:hypothetical protein
MYIYCGNHKKYSIARATRKAAGWGIGIVQGVALYASVNAVVLAWGSKSKSKTFAVFASSAASLTLRLVFPAPPFMFANTIVFTSGNLSCI